MSHSSTSDPLEEIVTFFSRGPARDEIASFRLSDAAQRHIRALLAKNSDGTLTSEEDRELDRIMVLNDVISLMRARISAQSDHSMATPASTGA